MFVLGITGNIASGKSTVAQFLKNRGFIWLNADKIGHNLLKEKSPIYQEIKTEFNTTCRKRIREIVFNDSQKLAKLNQLSHPYIKKAISSCLDKLSLKKIEKVALEAALLFEIGLDCFCDQILAVLSDESIALKRLKKRGIELETGKKIITKQKPLSFFKEKASFVIVNNGNKKALFEQVKKILDQNIVKKNKKIASKS